MPAAIMPRMKGPRPLIAAAVALVVIVVAVIVVAAGGSDDGGDEPPRTVRSRLTLEQFVQPDTGAPELLITLPDKRLNSLDTTGGEKSVLLRCVDARGREAIRTKTMWPLLEEYGYPLPHIHQLARQRVIDGIRTCRLTGTGIDFTGRVSGRPPRAAQ